MKTKADQNVNSAELNKTKFQVVYGLFLLIYCGSAAYPHSSFHVLWRPYN
jgi:hypothetical protein